MMEAIDRGDVHSVRRTLKKKGFAIDAIFRLTQLALQIILTTGHLWVRAWMAVDAYGNAYFDRAFVPPIDVHATRAPRGGRS